MKNLFWSLFGWLGTVCILSAYFANSLDILSTESIFYPVLNLIGAICLGIEFWHKRIFSTFFLEIIWGSIAIISIAKIIFKK